ncbi:HlyD family secretion protein [Dyella acidisoli]|uniref:Secretion protein n=2 Tax=Dyella acidisoli TaxID=1867834 RepID=A0ABQ5XLY6_9GAMM|nr:secretion protein [Dyella acidisoli]
MGSIVVASKPSHWIISIFALTLVICLVLFGCFAKYTRRESVSGQLLPGTGLISVDASSKGAITKLYVREGQAVSKGQLIAELTEPQSSTTLGDTHTIVSTELDKERSHLESDMAERSKEAKLQSDELIRRIALLQAQVDEISSQEVLINQKATASKEMVGRMKPLNKSGYISDLQLQQQEAVSLDNEGQQKLLARQRLDLLTQISAAKRDLEQIPLETTTRNNETSRQMAELNRTQAESEEKHRLMLHAPADGIVSALIVEPGQTLSAGQSLMTILPRGSALYAQLLVPSRAIGFIRQGDTVTLRYRAFPYQEFGQYFGRITDISRTALSAEQVSAVGGPTHPDEPVYRVMVDLNEDSVQAYGRKEPLLPGMALDADVRIDRRTLLQWMFEPLYGAQRRLDAGHG